MNTASSAHFDLHYQSHLKHLKLKGLQPKTVEAYSRAIRRIGNGVLVHGMGRWPVQTTAGQKRALMIPAGRGAPAPGRLPPFLGVI